MMEVLGRCGLKNTENSYARRASMKFVTINQLERVADLMIVKYDQMKELRKAYENDDDNGGVISPGQYSRIKAFIFWVTLKKAFDEEIDLDDFTVNIMDEYVERTQIYDEAKSLYQENNQKALLPGEIQMNMQFHEWNEKFKNYLSALMGNQSTVLSYVIRDDPPEDLDDPDLGLSESDKEIYKVKQHGKLWDDDNNRVYRIIKQCAVGTLAWEWMRNQKFGGDGRKAYIAVCNWYAGENVTSERALRAGEQMKTLHYSGNESAYTFDKYTQNLMTCFTALRNDGQQFQEKTKVSQLLEGMRRAGQANTELQVQLGNIRQNSDKYTFERAVDSLSTIISSQKPLIPNKEKRMYISQARNEPSKRPYRGGGWHREYGRNGQGGRGGRGGQGRGQHDGMDRSMINGVDVVDPQRNFTGDEWYLLGTDGNS